MAKGLAAGMTDYSHQSIQDMISDLVNERAYILNTIENLEKWLDTLSQNGYWQEKVPMVVRANLAYIIKFCHTTEEEFADIIDGIQKEVEDHQVTRLKSIAKTASEINKDIGQAWHSHYDRKEYGKADFRLVEKMYCNGRDTAVNLLDIDNLAGRLKDFVGRKGTNLKPIAKNILFLMASPDDQDKLRGDVEARRVEERLGAAKYRDQFKLIKKEAVKVETITKTLMDNNPQFIHFTGHGDQDGIALENEYGETAILPKSGLKQLFSLFKTTTEAVILSACHSAKLAKEISKLGIFVIGMNDSIDENVAIDFSIGFYQAIGDGKDIEFAFKLGLVLISQHVSNTTMPTLWKDGKKIIT